MAKRQDNVTYITAAEVSRFSGFAKANKIKFSLIMLYVKYTNNKAYMIHIFFVLYLEHFCYQVRYLGNKCIRNT